MDQKLLLVVGLEPVTFFVVTVMMAVVILEKICQEVQSKLYPGPLYEPTLVFLTVNQKLHLPVSVFNMFMLSLHLDVAIMK